MFLSFNFYFSYVHIARHLSYDKLLQHIHHSVPFKVHSRSHTHTHPFNGPLSRTIQICQYQKDKTSLDFTEARDSEWQWHQLGHMQVCT